MLLKGNLLESITLISCSGSVVCILLNYVTNISPITGVWFTIYVLLLFFLSLTLSFKFIQWLLHLNKPVKYDLDVILKNYPYLSFLSGILPRLRQREIPQECKEYDTNELSVISTVLERKLVSSWYVPYVSEEIGFPFACKQMLDQMIARAFQICNKIETKDVYIDICSVLISHLKEYKKAIKRQEKSTSTIESLYKKTHSISNNTDKKYQSADHCTNILRIILKELVPWELWDTPHSELLVRILSKKLDNFIDSTLADPIWLNDKLLTILEGNEHSEIKTVPEKKPEEKEIQEDIKKEIPKEVKEIPTEKELLKPEITTIESALSTLITKSTAPILQRAINEDFAQVPNKNPEDIVDEVGETASEPLDIKSSPLLRQRRGRQGKSEVKIYDRIIEGSVKTWETDIDLQCISLGQDLLASLNGEITLSRLWGQDPAEPDSGKSDQALWFGEEDSLDMDLTDTSPKTRSPVKKEFSPKPADALLKDLQTTVHQAKTKIGDLQVERHIDVPRNSNDEAAGMMEGLLDFGIAGLKKGLRFTGLSDDPQMKSPSHLKERSGEKTSPAELNRMKPLLSDAKDPNAVQKEENGVNAVPHLVKQQRVASQDSVPSQAKPTARDLPAPLTPLPPTPLPPSSPADSPEPEYEEAADLSTSIAKLRCLLEQRASSSPESRTEDIWWEGAEETRGRTHHHHSTRPIDTATLADEYDMSIERNTSPGQTSNNMQRLDRLFQRTVTGVFNSIKTAVGAEGEAGVAGAGEGPHATVHWTFVCTSVELSTGGAVARLVGSRRAYSRVDAALDSLDQLATPPPAARDAPPDDFDEWCAEVGGGWCAGASLAGAGGLCERHVAYRAATLLLADLAENLINIWLDDLTSWMRKQIFLTFEDMANESPEVPGVRDKRVMREFNVDETCAAVMGKIPALHLFGEETVSKAVRLSVLSFSHKDVNKDVIFRVVDLCALHFKNSAGIRNPSFDNN